MKVSSLTSVATYELSAAPGQIRTILRAIDLVASRVVCNEHMHAWIRVFLSVHIMILATRVGPLRQSSL